MREHEGTARSGDPAFGVVMAAAGMAISLLLTLLFGVVAGAVAALLGVGAIVTGLRARRGGRGAAAIVAGAAAVVLAVVSTVGSVTLMNRLHDRAVASGRAPVFSASFEPPCLGFSGLILNVAGDRTKLKQMVGELNTLQTMPQETLTAEASSDRSDT